VNTLAGSLAVPGQSGKVLAPGGPAPLVRLAGELPFIEWIEFRPHVPGRHGGFHPDVGPSIRFSPREQDQAHEISQLKAQF